MSETSNFTREQATKGYKVVSNTTPTAKDFYGFTVISEAVISAVVAPTNPGPEGTSYDGDETGIATTLPVGYYPVRGSSITLTSGAVILWLE